MQKIKERLLFVWLNDKMKKEQMWSICRGG